MCLVAFAWQLDPETPLLLLANRDEFFERPSAPMACWVDQPDIIAGRDLRAGGTWLGFHRANRRLAVVTNVREPNTTAVTPVRSRGFLVPDYLKAEVSVDEFAQQLLQQGAPQYDGYNLLLFDGDQGVCVSNRAGAQRLSPGVYGLSNAELNTAWPKVDAVKEGVQRGLQAGYAIEQFEQLFRSPQQVEDAKLPSTGVPLDWERKLSAVFIDGDPVYGTRALSSVQVQESGKVCLREWSRASLADSWSLQQLEA